MSLQFACEIAGTIAFAISGAMLAIERKMDIFGVMVLGLVTATGGGLMRDVIIGTVPPKMFTSRCLIPIALCTALYTYWTVHKHRHLIPLMPEGRFQFILNLTDAIGLGLFTVAGVNEAVRAGYGTYDMMVVFLGTLTGVGGGMLRDVLAGVAPAILVKHVYAVASLLGAACYDCLLRVISENIATFVSVAVIITVRMLAYHYKWNLPRALD